MIPFLPVQEFEKRYQTRPVPPEKFIILLVEDEPELVTGLEYVVELAIAQYGVEPKDIEWYCAPNGTEAIEAARKIDALPLDWKRGYRGVDAVFCDLRIPWTTEAADVTFGFRAAESIAALGWQCPIVGLSALSESEQVLGQRRTQFRDAIEDGGSLIFDDFLRKDAIIDPDRRDWARNKLAQHLVPTGRFAKALRTAAQPTEFVNPRQLKVLRRLIQIAQLLSPRACTGRLPQMLMLGPPGAGKTHFARAYRELLGVTGVNTANWSLVRRVNVAGPFGPFELLNCGLLSSQDLSGGIMLFGARNLGSHVAPDSNGVFERATTFKERPGAMVPKKVDGKLTPVYERGGVAMLDEVANLPRNLQAAVLTAMEERIIHRVGGHLVDIGCHVICATNVDPTKAFLSADETGHLAEKPELQLRRDLVDRVDFVLGIPGLRDFAIEEIEELIRRFVARAISATGQTIASNQVSITRSARELLATAIDNGALTSLRQLQSVATVVPGDDIVTEANLRWLLEKDRLINLPLRRQAKHEVEVAATGQTITPMKMAAALSLPVTLQTDALPHWTIDALTVLHDVVANGKRQRHDDIRRADPEVRSRYYLLANLPSVRAQFVAVGIQQSDSLSTAVGEYRRLCGIPAGLKKKDLAEKELEVLLSQERRTDQPLDESDSAQSSLT